MKGLDFRPFLFYNKVMRSDDILLAIQQDKDMMAVLGAIAELNLPDSWLAAGAVRNFIWNKLTDKPAFDYQTDMDVVYFDPKKSYEETLSIQEFLSKNYPNYRWEVKNQVDMHQHSPNTAPYQSARDAISKYPEKCTAIAVRLRNDKLELFAPYGLDDIIHFRVSPTPHFLADEERMDVYRKRLLKKKWHEKWPKLYYETVL